MKAMIYDIHSGTLRESQEGDFRPSPTNGIVVRQDRFGEVQAIRGVHRFSAIKSACMNSGGVIPVWLEG